MKWLHFVFIFNFQDWNQLGLAQVEGPGLPDTEFEKMKSYCCEISTNPV